MPRSLVDLDQPRLHDLHPEFQIHPGHGNKWHHHPQTLEAMFSFEPMTLRQALSVVGVELSNDAVAFHGNLYDTSDPAITVTVHVDAIQVDPDTHVIGDGDRITIEVTTGR